MKGIAVLVCVAVGAVVVGCGEDKVITGANAPAAAKGKAAQRGASRGEVAESDLPEGGLPPVDFAELDFGESERSRDPFRPFEEAVTEEAQRRIPSQLDVVLPNHALEDLRLTAIVLGANPSRAMFVDRKGKGHTVRRGQFVGRPETFATDGQSGAIIEAHWRVDQIRASDVVFVREDPNNPDVPSATKVVSLHPAGETEELD